MGIDNRTLYIVTCVSNPLLWKSRARLAEAAIREWLRADNVKVLIVECVYGGRAYQLDEIQDPRLTHVPVKAASLLWTKENLMNIGIASLPHEAEYILTADADVIWRGVNWSTDIINALDIHPVVQPWQSALDLGPGNQHLSVHNSFAFLHSMGKEVTPRFDKKTLSLTNAPYTYPHPGFAWAWRRDFLDWVGGLFEHGGVGAGDHHMALSLINAAEKSIPEAISNSYHALLKAWEHRANVFNGFKLGHVADTIEHMFHGSKTRRGYNTRWHMFVNHKFDPVTDVKRNSYGVLEFAGNKPKLEAEWLQYLRARFEDGTEA